MMKGRFLAGGLGTKDPPLIQLVEKYLADNSNLSYINIDDMIDYFQAQYFRFARMQRKVFANQVRSAYFDYCRRNSNNEKQPENNPQTPQNPQTPPVQQLDSDVEEIEEDTYVPRNDFVNSSLTALYKASAGNANLVKTPGNPPIGIDPQNVLHASANANNLHGMAVPTTTTHSSSEPASDSDDDLEIIDEVQGRNVIQKVMDVMDGTNDRQASSSSLLPSGITVTVVGSEGSDGNRPIVPIRSNNHLLNDAALPVGSGNASKNSPERMIKKKPGHVTLSSASSTVPMSRFNNGRNCADSTISFNPAESQFQRGTKRKNLQSPVQGVTDNGSAPKKLKKEVTVVTDSGYRLADFAGSEKVVEEVCRLLMHLKHPEVYKTLGVTAPRGFLLHGPPGVGKTLLANAISGELQLPMLKVTGTEFVSGISGESESNIRDLFNQATAIAPSIIFIDEIDSITPKRETAQREMERRIVAQLLSCVDDLMNHVNGSQVLLIGATNRIEAIDTALRRAGRFDKEICLGIPDEKSRQRILEVICRNLRLAPGFDLGALAKVTPGYVGADLQMLVREAAVQAVNKALMYATTRKSGNLDSMNDHVENMETVITPENAIIDVIPETTEAQAQDPVSGNIIIEENKADGIGGENDIINPTQEEPTSIEVPDSSESIVKSSENVVEVEVPPADEIPKTSEVCEIELEEKMDVDPEEPDIVDGSTPQITKVVSEAVEPDIVDGSIPQITNVVSEAEEKVQDPDEIGVPTNDDMDSKITEERQPEMAPYLRWIKETAPLSASQLDELYLFFDDFEEALKHVQPSSKREGFATVPDTTWEDIGALADIREELEVSILGPVKYSSAYETLGLMSAAGVLLCGPPGCGKTLLAKAVAHEAGINFISVKGPELLNMYVGESERAVRQCFIRAKNSSPCVIFFDEIDALCPRRSDAPESGSGSRIVNQLLTEMDGVEGRQGVFIMAATNRPDILDPAILRPGRLDKLLFVDLPSSTDRFEILKAITKNGKKPVLSSDVDLKAVAEKECCENYTGADLAALVREASIAAFKDLVMNKSQDSATQNDLKVSMRHFEIALLKTKPSVTKEERGKYAKMKERYSSIRER